MSYITPKHVITRECCALFLSVLCSLSVVTSVQVYASDSFHVIESPKILRDHTRIFNWAVRTQAPSGYKSKSYAQHPTFVQHHTFSVLAYAKAISADKINQLRYDTYSNELALVASESSLINEAKTYQDTIAMLPEVSIIRYEPGVKHTFVPNDQCFFYQREFNPPSISRYKGAVNLVEAWDLERGRGSPDIIIGVLDSGIVNHTDIDQSRMVLGNNILDFVSSPAQSADGDGRDNDPTDPGVATDCNYSSGYHGTHVTGTLAANSNNTIGITGVNWRSKIIPVRVLGPVDGSTGDIIDAVNWISNNPAVRVLNLSLGVSNISCNDAFFLRPDFISRSVSNNIVSVMAAGNNHADAADFSPANCQGAFTVAATNAEGNKAYYSNYGPNVDISAPGGEFGKFGNNIFGIFSTVNKNHYDYKQGTSMATPVVAGIASLVYSRNPDLTADEVKNILLATASPFQNIGEHGLQCDTEICGAGIVNAKEALEHATATEPALVFFPRQEKHALIDTPVSVQILLSKKVLTPVTLRIDATADSCTLSSTAYDVTIDSNTLEQTIQIHEPDCNLIALSLDKTTAGIGYPTNGKDKIKITFVDPNNLQSPVNFEEIHWSYLSPGSQAGNSHSVVLPESGTYYLSVVSDLNTEISVINAATGERLYDSMEEDRRDVNKYDPWIKYTVDRAHTLTFTVRERSTQGSGGLYAVSLTTIPSFTTELAAYCEVPRGVQTSCGTPSSPQSGTTHTDAAETDYVQSSSISLYILLALCMILLLSLLRRNNNI